MEKLTQINLVDFFNPKYQRYNNGLGISGTGIITPSKMLNVLNLSKTDPITGKVMPGIAEHPITIKAVLEEMYGADVNSEVADIEERVIRIRYRNEDRGEGETREAIIETPAYLNNFQIKCLRDICSTLFSMEDPPHVGGIVYSVDPRRNYQEGFIIHGRPWELRYGYDEVDEDEERESIEEMLIQLEKDCKKYDELREFDDLFK